MQTSILIGLILMATSLFNSPEVPNESEALSVHSFTVKTIDGKSVKLREYAGKKLLIVNTASECGYTPQYKDLQELATKYADKVVVLGFPSNNFGGQEPGSNAEIKSFCTKNYGVTFPMFDKVEVLGDKATPLFKYLSNKSQNGVVNDAPKWNFCKYLIDENGKVIKFFPSSVKPTSSEITSLL
jgi:glutathione peroxidase